MTRVVSDVTPPSQLPMRIHPERSVPALSRTIIRKIIWPRKWFIKNGPVQKYRFSENKSVNSPFCAHRWRIWFARLSDHHTIAMTSITNGKTVVTMEINFRASFITLRVISLVLPLLYRMLARKLNKLARHRDRRFRHRRLSFAFYFSSSWNLVSHPDKCRLMYCKRPASNSTNKVMCISWSYTIEVVMHWQVKNYGNLNEKRIDPYEMDIFLDQLWFGIWQLKGIWKTLWRE